MKNVSVIIGASFFKMKHTIQNDLESSIEWKLYDYISREFTLIRIITSSLPYKN